MFTYIYRLDVEAPIHLIHFLAQSVPICTDICVIMFLYAATVEPVRTSLAPSIRSAKPCLLPIGRTIQPGGIMALITRTSGLLATPSQYKIFTDLLYIVSLELSIKL